MTAGEKGILLKKKKEKGIGLVANIRCISVNAKVNFPHTFH
jgi:hypothetical protein